MTFHVGQKVVCVNGNAPYLLTGQIYTVLSVEPQFLEVDCIPTGGHPSMNRHWLKCRFRPIVDKKTETGMAILREILDRESHQDKVPVRTRHMTV